MIDILVEASGWTQQYFGMTVVLVIYLLMATRLFTRLGMKRHPVHWGRFCTRTVWYIVLSPAVAVLPWIAVATGFPALFDYLNYGDDPIGVFLVVLLSCPTLAWFAHAQLRNIFT